jgi:hypothetical protein
MISALAVEPKITEWLIVWITGIGAIVTAGTFLFLVLQNVNTARSAAIERDRRFVLSALRDVGRDYAESVTSALPDARCRAYGSAWVSYEAIGGVTIPVFEHAMSSMDKVIEWEHRVASPDIQTKKELKNLYDQNVIVAIGRTLNQAARQPIEEFAEWRSLPRPMPTAAAFFFFSIASLLLVVTITASARH